jgi:hypothetical protein
MTVVQMRIYRPMSVTELRRLAERDALEPAPFAAYTVTAGLRREHPGADEEELEYLAFTDAVTTGLADGAARVVAAADVDEELVDANHGGGTTTVVRVIAPVPRRQVASFHVADPSAAGGTPELSWYDATELDVVVDLLTS